MASRRTGEGGLLALAATWLTLNVTLLAITELGVGRTPHVFGPSTATIAQFKSFAGSDPNHRISLLRLRLMQPLPTSTEEIYPLLVFLHGAGQRGSDNLQQLKGLPEQMALPYWRGRFRCFVLAPQCPDGTHWSDWMDELEQIVDYVSRELPVDRRRIYLTGLSMGGFGSWELAVRRPKLFAAVVPICGGGDTAWGSRLVNVPVWAVHGDSDRSVSVERSRNMIEAIGRAGGQPRYTELPGVGHDSWTQTYRDPQGVLPWMFQQINSHGPAPPSDQSTSSKMSEASSSGPRQQPRGPMLPRQGRH